MAATSTPDGAAGAHVPARTGGGTGLATTPNDGAAYTNALTPTRPAGLSIAASGIAGSMPVVTPAPGAAPPPGGN